MAESEKRKKLLESVKKFNKSQKGKVVDFAVNSEEFGIIPTGVKQFDDFIGGGLKRGAHTILWGGYSVGKTAMALTAVANAQKEGLTCCYVNLEKPIEPERFEWFGINRDEMLYIEAPNNAEQALEALRTFCKDKVIDLFIIDSIQGMCPKATKENKGGKERGLDEKEIAELPRVLSKFYSVVNADIYNAKAVVLWIGQTRTGGIGTFFVRAQLSGGKAQEFFAYQIIFMRTGQSADAPVEKYKETFIDPDGKERYRTKSRPLGFDCVFRMDKTNASKSVLKNETLHLPYYNKTGFNPLLPCAQDKPTHITAGEEQRKKENFGIPKLEDIKHVFKPNGKNGEHTIIDENKKPGKKVLPTFEYNDDTKISKNTDFSKDSPKTIDVPTKKKRGRPKKEKK